MPSVPTTEDAVTGTVAATSGTRLVVQNRAASARLLLVLSALGIGLLTKLSFDPGPASELEVGLGVAASAAFLIAVAAALSILGTRSSSPRSSLEPSPTAGRSGRILTVGFLAGLTLMVLLGLVAGLAALQEPAANPAEPSAPFESTVASGHAGGVDPV